MSHQGRLNLAIDIFKKSLPYSWGELKPLCLLFSTQNNKYLYDSGSNKIVKCGPAEFDLLSCFLAADDLEAGLQLFFQVHTHEEGLGALASLTEAVSSHNILKLTNIRSFNLSHNPSHVIQCALNSLGIILLELTQTCNLRCGYCIYNEGFSQNRNHGSLHMTEEIALKAIDHVRRCSTERKEVSIGFYGGEPILNFELLKEVVSYARHHLPDREVSFSLTTNGTLIDDVIANYLVREDIGVLISIDGPELIHDTWRRDANNRGSFKAAFRSLELLVEKFKGRKKVGLSMVYAPPYSEKKLDQIYSFLAELTWLPKDIKVAITYPHVGSLTNINKSECDTAHTGEYDFSLSEYTRNRYLGYYINKAACDPITSSIIETKLARLIQRPILNSIIAEAQLNGCCYPGSRRLFITADGEMKLCERVGLSPNIGNVRLGLDADTIEKVYINEYSTKSLDACSRCWLIRLCSICYQQAFFNNSFDIDKKSQYCAMQRMAMEKDLKFYCSLREIDPHGLDYLYDWEMK